MGIFEESLKPDRELSINQWADEFRYLPSVSSAEPGRYRTKRMPYVKEIMEVLSPNHPVRQVKCIKGTQLGLTEVANNLIMCIMDCYAGPILMVMPTDGMAEKHSKQKLQPSIDQTPSLKEKVKDRKSRDSGNTIRVKEFSGGILVMAGSNTTNSFRSFSARYAIGDDVDGFKMDVAEEGAPLDLLKKRCDAFPNHKIYINSTPTIKGGSNIEKEFEDSDKRIYYVPCPFCEHFQPLVWSNIKFKHVDYQLEAGSVFYECENCREELKEFHKVKMLEGGKWIPQNPGHPYAGFKISSLYSPIGFLSWAEVAREFLTAKKQLKGGDKTAMVTWTNTRLAETWEDKGATVNQEILFARREDYLKDGAIPDEVLMLTLAADCQPDRIEYEVKGWGVGQECWGIEYGVFYKAIDSKELWEDLDAKLLETWTTKSGIELGIAGAAIDSGYRNDLVYKFCKGKGRRKIFAVKGANTSGKPIIGQPSRLKKDKIRLFIVGTDTAKQLIFTRLVFKEPGPGYMHFPKAYDKNYFEQLTAEKLNTRYVKGYAVREWVKIKPRNEVLDITVYSFAIFRIINPPWKEIKRKPKKQVEGGTSEEQETKAPETSEPETEKNEPAAKKRKPARGKSGSGWAVR